MFSDVASLGRAGGAVVLILAIGACTPVPDATKKPAGVTPAPSTAATIAPTVIPPTAAPASPVASAAGLGFTPGTTASPRVIEITTNDNLQFSPGFIQVARGDTVTFKVHNTGEAVHEFMVGPAKAALADVEGTPEVADIAGGETKSLTTTFDGDGPYAFACHAPGHFEHGMVGYIQVVGPGAPTLGTAANPRLVWMNMDDTLKFMPDAVQVAAGETIRFVLTNSGKVTHEFQVGPADKVAADQVDGVSVLEKDELVAGSTTALDYTFGGAGPYAYACHEPGHYEAGMRGTILIQP